jgi:hypothetical protein
MKTPRSLLTAFLAVFVLTATAFAAEVAGSWKWTSVSKTGGAAEVTALLALKEGKLTGTVTGRQGPAEITDSIVNGNQVSFTVVRTAGDTTVIFKYSGELAGDTITGTIEKTGPGKDAKPTTTDWKATRVK